MNTANTAASANPSANGSMSGTWLLRVDAGPHHRRHCPVSTILPGAADAANLLVAGRKRPIPCQFETTSTGTRLHWIVEDLKPGESAEYRLQVGDRKRRPTPRVRLLESEGNWDARFLEKPLAEILVADGAAPAIVPVVGNARMPIRIAGRSNQESSNPVCRHRVGPPGLMEGTVRGEFASVHRCRSAEGTPLWSETHSIVFHEPANDFWLVDWSVRLFADAGPVRLADGTASFGPGLMVVGDAMQDSVWTASPGWIADEMRGKPAPFVFATFGSWHFGTMARSDGFGFPPVWNAANGALSALPSGGTRILPLGGHAEFTARLIFFQSRQPRQFVAERYADFDCPPGVTCSF